MKKIFLLLLIIVIASCSLDDDSTSDPIFCTEELRPGLEITVRNSVTNDVLTEGVKVIATDGSYTEELENFTDTDVFIGAFERRGTYIITVTKNSYQTFISDIPIIVDADICHVITESRTILLEAN